MSSKKNHLCTLRCATRGCHVNTYTILKSSGEIFGHTQFAQRCSIGSFSVIQKLTSCLILGQYLEPITLSIASGFHFGRGLLDLKGNKEKLQVVLYGGKSYFSKLTSRNQITSAKFPEVLSKRVALCDYDLRGIEKHGPSVL